LHSTRSKFFLLVILCLTTISFTQTETATISGRVTDQQGGLVQAAEVVITSVETNLSSRQATNGGGLYVLSGLKPGRYRITVTKGGFRSVNLTDVVLNVQDSISQNFKLQVGSVSESITVVANGANVNTSDASVSTVVDRQFVENIPLNGRSFQSLLTATPGVTIVGNLASQGQAGVGFGGEITVNGQRTEANYFTVDGVSANTGTAPGQFGVGAGYAGAVPAGSTLGTTQSLVSIDALQEFRATTSTYSAEYGRTPGGQFSFITRSGTNDWHGSAYDYFRNDVMDANNWFNAAATPPIRRQRERQNDFGGVLGGPIIIPSLYNGRNKTFFFFSYEGLRLLQPEALFQSTVPDAGLRQSAPAALQPVLNAFPLPNGGEDGLNDGLGFYNQVQSTPSSLDDINFRLDHSFSQKFKIFGRYAYTPSDVSRYSLAIKTTQNINVRGLTLGATNLITARQSNEFRFNITQNNGALSFFETTTLGGATPFNLTSIPGPNGAGFPAAPQGGDLGVCVCYGEFSSLELGQQPNAQRQYNVTDTYNWTVGSHSLKFGADWRRLATTITPHLIGESLLYFSEASILANSADSARAFSQSPSAVEPVYTNFSAFAQDEWKATHRLSLSAGLRWDVNPAPGNAMGPSPYTVDQINNFATTMLAPAGTPLWKTDWHAFAPRFGLAYQVGQTPGYETVVRSGFGMFYDMGNTQGSQGFGGVGFSSSAQYPGVSFPLTSAQLQQVPPQNVAPPYNRTVYAFDPHLKLPYTLQWNLAVEQGLGAGQSLTVSYVGSAGRRLLTEFFYLTLLDNPNFSSDNGLQLTTNRATSSYNALQVRYQKRLSRGLQALASYTWSHSIDNASNNSLLFELLRASSDFDIQHNFQAAVTYDIPGTYSNPVLSMALRHWGLDTRISARSGLPVDIIGTRDFNPATQQYQTFHPDLVPGQPLYVKSLQTCPGTAGISPPPVPGGRLINYCAFTPSAAGTDGNTPRNFARGFNGVEADLALRREFAIHEGLRLQFRAEAFNIFNHANFGFVQNHLFYGPSQFGFANNTLNNALGGLSALYQTGGPRSLQLALKLLF
jgi:hypothetical protein